MDILIEEYEGSLWAAALEKGRLEGLEIDPSYETVRWGSVYWAKITRIDASLDAVFLDLDGENTGILYNRDVRIQMPDGSLYKGGDKPIGKTLKAGDFIAVQAKTAYLKPPEDEAFWQRESKVPQMSMDLTLQGRYLVFGPMVHENRISSRIRGKKRRAQLESMMTALDDDLKGFILRSAAADMQTEILTREAKILKETWLRMSTYLEGSEPALIMLGPDSVQRILADHAIKSIDRIEVATMDHFALAEDWCAVFAPDLMTKIDPIQLNNGQLDLALFEHRDLIGQIEALFQGYVLLPGGGNIIIEETAALISIDVNQGGSKQSKLAINMEAAEELTRQMRLRNMGGIIVVDFLKMNGKDNDKILIKTLQDDTFDDPCTVQIHGMTKLGLVEITRKRRTPALWERFDGVEI